MLYTLLAKLAIAIAVSLAGWSCYIATALALTGTHNGLTGLNFLDISLLACLPANNAIETFPDLKKITVCCPNLSENITTFNIWKDISVSIFLK